jgi:hypothetical protein
MLSNVCIIFVEYVNRGATGTFWQTLPYIGLPILAAQWCLFQSWNGAPHWMLAWVVFVIGNSIMRVIAVYLGAGDEISQWPHVLLGVTVMLAGALLVKEGLQ